MDGWIVTLKAGVKLETHLETNRLVSHQSDSYASVREGFCNSCIVCVQKTKAT